MVYCGVSGGCIVRVFATGSLLCQIPEVKIHHVQIIIWRTFWAGPAPRMPLPAQMHRGSKVVDQWHGQSEPCSVPTQSARLLPLTVVLARFGQFFSRKFPCRKEKIIDFFCGPPAEVKMAASCTPPTSSNDTLFVLNHDYGLTTSGGQGLPGFPGL